MLHFLNNNEITYDNLLIMLIRLVMHEMYFFYFSIDSFLNKYRSSSYLVILDIVLSAIVTFDRFVGVVDVFICFSRNFIPLQRLAN